MAKNKRVLRRIHVVEYTKKITQAMKMVSVAKLSMLKRADAPLQRYSDCLEGLFLRTMSNTTPRMLRSFTRARKTKHILCLVVTSNQGLCGTYNHRILEALRHYHATAADLNCCVTFLPIGQKALKYLKAKQLSYNDAYVGLSDTLGFEKVQELSRYFWHSFRSNDYQRIVLLGQTSMRGEAVVPQHFLPYTLPEVVQEENATIYEPNAPYLLRNLMMGMMDVTLYKRLLEMVKTEHKSRVLAMGQSTDNAETLLQKLKTTYNRIRKASVTRDLIETTAGMALSSLS